MLVDGFARRVEYLRLSVTDRCNLRCLYCMPEQVSYGTERDEILSVAEIVRMVVILSSLGIKRVRLTGGEPLIRPELPDLVRQLRGIRGIEEVALTTNGVLLKPLARPLKEAGLSSLNIHLDTLFYDKFRQITRWGNLAQVLAGLDEAKEVGFEPIKLNTVIVRGFNDSEVEHLLLFAARHRLVLRLIELMPIGPARQMQESYLSPEEIRQRLAEKYTLEPSAESFGRGPAVYYRVKELDTPIGFISPVSQPFCRNCNRIRLASDGRFQDCLAYDGVVSFRALLRDPQATDENLAARVMQLIQGKRESHGGFSQAGVEGTPCMFGIGG